MSKELLLNIDMPSTSAASTKQTTAINGEAEDNTLFSSALNEQLSTQSTSENTVEGNALLSQQASTSVAETENTAVESGNELPIDTKVTEHWLQQLLPDADEAMLDELAQQLTEFVAPLLTQVTEGQISDQDAVSQIEQWISQFTSANGQPVTDIDANVTNETINTLVAELELSAPVVEKLTQFLTVIAAQLTPVQQSTAKTLMAEQATVMPFTESKTTPNRHQNNDPSVTSARVAASSSLPATSILEADSEPTQSKTSDKVTRIAELVRQVVPQTKAEQTTVSSVQELKLAPSELVPTTTSDRGQRVAELVQSLTSKQMPTELSSFKQEASNTVENKTTPINLDTKLERIAQLVSLLKPALKEETVKNVAQADKPAATLLSSSVAALTNQTATTSTPKAVPTLDIQPTLQNAAWNRVLTSRVVWLASEGIQQASLKLNPAQLGPVEVRMTMHNEQTNITFVAHHATTRDALEQALPRLRESFAENGLELGDANVSEQTSQQANDQQGSDDNSNGFQEAGLTTQSEQQSTKPTTVGVEQDIELGVNVYA